MQTKYQLITIGHHSRYSDQVIALFKEKIIDLGLDEASIQIINASNFSIEFKENAPAVCVYFGEATSDHKDLSILNKLLEEAVFIIPAVSTLENFSTQVPEKLKGINGIQLHSELDISPLVSRLLEGLSLLRLARRLFISYRRKESRAIAIQLYEHLDQAGFDVFLDTHSINPGDTFQDELWHRLVDTDVVVLLDTPEFLQSKWTAEELAKASAMSIGILKLVWPNHKPIAGSELCFFKYLNEDDFEERVFNTPSSHLKEDTIKSIVSFVESLRARSLAARQDNLIKEFMVSARKQKLDVVLQPEKFMTVASKNGEISVIPTVGVPHAFTYNQTEELIKRIRSQNAKNVFLIFDERNIREKWQTHLGWLDQYLPVKSIKVTAVDNWLAKL